MAAPPSSRATPHVRRAQEEAEASQGTTLGLTGPAWPDMGGPYLDVWKLSICLQGKVENKETGEMMMQLKGIVFRRTAGFQFFTRLKSQDSRGGSQPNDQIKLKHISKVKKEVTEGQ